MDTISHTIFGFGLAALAQLDPVVADHQALSQAVLIGTVIGSNAPDFDCVFLLKGKGSYYRHHRGHSHALPVLPLLGMAVAASIFPFFHEISFLPLFFWTLFAVIVHVFLDLFNVHGTQILKPFSEKWVSFDSIALTDSYLLLIHVLGFCLLPFFSAGLTFLIIYIFILIYIGIRSLSTFITIRNLQRNFLNATRVKLTPLPSMFKWNVLIETKDDFLFGTYTANALNIELSFEKKMNLPALVTESKKEQPVSDFLSSTEYAFPFIRENKDGFFVHWKDLRFRSNKFFTSVAILFISNDRKRKNCHLGSLSSLRAYKRVLKKLKNTPVKESTGRSISG